MNVANLNLSRQLKQAVGQHALAQAQLRAQSAPANGQTTRAGKGGKGTQSAKETAQAATAAQPMAATANAPLDAATVPLNLPPTVTNWLAQLSLLYGVPFDYLVPDIRLLPTETIRFFYIDPNWIQRAIDGALAIGTTSSRDNVFNEAFYQQVYAAVQAAIPQVRQTVQGTVQPAQITVGATTTGFLFRSAVVSGYPGLEVKPTYQGNPISILRMDRLSSDIMLVLFNGVPDNVEIRQPPEGLHFGITRAPGASTFKLYLRWLGHTTNSSDEAGQQIKQSGQPWQLGNLPLRAPFAGANPGVIDVASNPNAVVGTIVKTLGTTYLGANQVFTSAEFAIEMVLSAGVQPYSVTPPTA